MPSNTAHVIVFRVRAQKASGLAFYSGE